VNGESLNTVTKEQLVKVLRINSRIHLKSFLTAREILFGRKQISSSGTQFTLLYCIK
jgi:hypothetical protein